MQSIISWILFSIISVSSTLATQTREKWAQTVLLPQTLRPIFRRSSTLKYFPYLLQQPTMAWSFGNTWWQLSSGNYSFMHIATAGSIAGSVEHMAMFPVDTLKTRIQALGATSSSSSCPNPIHSLGLRQALTSILKLEGPSGLYRGIAAMGLGAGPAHAVYFSVYELCKQTFSSSNNSSWVHAASGVCATVTSDAVFTPMDVVKQRLQLKSSPYKGVVDCVRRIVVEEGVGAFYRSYWTTVVMNAPFTAVHFAAYEAAKRAMVEVAPESADDGRWVVHATAGAAAGALAAALTTPLDVVKTQLQCQGVCGCDRLTSSSIGHVIERVIRKEGYRGLMRGYIPRMLFHAPAAAICWSTYEASKSFFQKKLIRS